MHLGDFQLIPLLDSYFRLDGGQMFEAVPMRLWEKEHAPDPFTLSPWRVPRDEEG